MEDARNSHTRYEAAELIECYIQRNDLLPHSRLPGEREMCEMWDLNRTTLRAAIRRLTELGKVYSLKGSGTYVAPPKLERNLQDAKSTTESVCSMGHRLKTRVLESQIVEANAYISQNLGVEIGQKVLFLRRLRIMDGIPYMIENNHVNLSRCPRLIEHDLSEESLYQVLAFHNVYIMEGTESVGVTYATDSEARSLQIASGAPLFYLSGIAKDAGGVPIEFFKSVAKPEMVRFSSILKKRPIDGERRNAE